MLASCSACSRFPLGKGGASQLHVLWLRHVGLGSTSVLKAGLREAKLSETGGAPESLVKGGAVQMEPAGLWFCIQTKPRFVNKILGCGIGEEWEGGGLLGPPGPAVDTKGPLASLGGNWVQLGPHWADWKRRGLAGLTGIILG